MTFVANFSVFLYFLDYITLFLCNSVNFPTKNFYNLFSRVYALERTHARKYGKRYNYFRKICVCQLFVVILQPNWKIGTYDHNRTTQRSAGTGG